MKDEALHCSDEAIALLPQNAEKLAAAVAQLRASLSVPTRKQPSVEQQIRQLGRQGGKLTRALRALIPAADSISQRARLASILGGTHQIMEQLERELGRVG